MSELTVICCYTDPEQFDLLSEGLSRQGIPYEIIGIDNAGGRYSSCAAAYNAALRDVKTEYVIFSHQDIRFPKNDLLPAFMRDMRAAGENDIIGVAGRKDSGVRPIFSGITQGNDCVPLRNVIRPDAAEEVQTVDECFFGGHTGTFRSLPFDEKLCDSWHLYAVERCLRAKLNGSKVRVSPVSINHLSSGKIDKNYYRNFTALCRAYKGKFDYIASTCYSASLDQPYMFLRLLIARIELSPYKRSLPLRGIRFIARRVYERHVTKHFSCLKASEWKKNTK